MMQAKNIKTILSVISANVVVLSSVFLFSFEVDALSKTSSCDVENYNELANELLSAKDRLCPIKAFDSQLGALQSAKISFKTVVTSKAALENLNSDNALIQANWSVDIGLSLNLIQTPHLMTQSPFGVLDTLPRYDGVLDFGGESGRSFSEVVVVDQNTQIFTHKDDLELFLQESDSQPELTIPIHFLAQQYQPQLNTSRKISIKSQAQIDVEYTYNTPDMRYAINTLKKSTYWDIINFGLMMINTGNGMYVDCLSATLNLFYSIFITGQVRILDNESRSELWSKESILALPNELNCI